MQFELTRFKEALAQSHWPLFELMRLKQRLAASFGVQEGFNLYQRAMELPECVDVQPKPVTDRDLIRHKPLRSLRSASENFDFFLEMDPPGEPFLVPPARVIGKSNSCTLRGLARSSFLTCVKDARVRGRSAFIDLEEVALLEYQGGELARLDDQLDFDPAIFQATNDAVWIITPKDNGGLLELDEAFTLLGPHAHDFGHWIWEYVPKYVAAARSGALPPVPILIDEVMPTTHRQALELMLPENVDVVTVAPYQSARVRRLWCAAGEFYLPVLEKRNERLKWDYFAAPPARFSALIRDMSRRADRVLAPVTGPERVFLARQSWRRRKLLNHVEIEAAARACGFQVIYPDELNFQEQVRIIRSARFVTGPDGSAFYLAFFARPGTKLCILSNPYTLVTQAEQTGLLSEAGIGVTVITGSSAPRDPEYPDFDDYTIDQVVFKSFLDQWLVS
jgi:capsular polysaccharide biosynthesis protein